MMTLLNTSFEKTLTIFLRCITFPLHSIKLCAFFRRKMPHFDQIMPIQLMQTMLYISIATSCVDNWCSHFSHAIRHFRMCHSIGIFTQLTKSCCQFLSILIYLFGIVGMQFRNRNNMCALCKQCEIYLSESAKKKKILFSWKRADTPIVFRTSILRVNTNESIHNHLRISPLYVSAFFMVASTSLSASIVLHVNRAHFHFCIAHKFARKSRSVLYRSVV